MERSEILKNIQDFLSGHRFTMVKRALLFSLLQTAVLWSLKFLWTTADHHKDRKEVLKLPISSKSLSYRHRIHRKQIVEKTFSCRDLKKLFLSMDDMLKQPWFTKYPIDGQIPLYKPMLQTHPSTSLSAYVPVGKTLYVLVMPERSKHDFIQIGDHVDIVAITKIHSSNHIFTETLIEDLEVQGKDHILGQESLPHTSQHSRFLFFLSPQERDMMLRAELTAKFQIFLRAPHRPSISTAQTLGDHVHEP